MLSSYINNTKNSITYYFIVLPTLEEKTAHFSGSLSIPFEKTTKQHYLLCCLLSRESSSHFTRSLSIRSENRRHFVRTSWKTNFNKLFQSVRATPASSLINQHLPRSRHHASPAQPILNFLQNQNTF